MHQDDEIDLIELFSDLWLGKWAIISFTLIAMIFGGSYAVYKERNQVFSYQSTISFTAKNLPPFYDTNHVFSDFRASFHSAPEFEVWKARNDEVTIEFNDIALTQFVAAEKL